MSKPDTSPEPLAVGVPGATHLTGLGRTTIYDKIKKGELASFTIGGKRLFLMSELRRFLEEAAKHAA